MTTPTTSFITLTDLPPPMTARLSMSAERDSAELQCSFSGHLPVADLQRTVTAMYFGEPLWKFGASEANYVFNEGNPTTNVTFRIGPFRYGKLARYTASYYLYRELVRQLPDLIQGATRFGGAAGRPGLWNRQQSSELAYWAYILADYNRNRAQDRTRPQAPMRNDIAENLLANIDMKSIVPYLKFDAAVRSLYESWMLMVRVDPAYLDRFTEQQLFTDWDMIPAPPLFMRNCLDQIELYYLSSYQFPIVRDKRITWPINLALREKEDTMLKFWHDGRNIADARIRVDPNTNVKPVLQSSGAYWRYEQAGNRPIDWTVGVEDIDGFTASNPWTIYSEVQLPSLNHAHLESHIAQQSNFLPNRMREVRAVAPDNAGELRRLLPGLPCEVQSNGQRYWVSDLEVSTPPLTMRLHLIYPPRHTRVPRAWNADMPDNVPGNRSGASPLDSETGLAVGMPAPATP